MDARSATGAPFVRLQLGHGLFGVTKLQWRGWRARNALSWIVASAFLTAAGLVVVLASDGDGPGWFRWTQWVAAGVLAVGVVARLVWEGTAGRLEPGQVPPWDRQLADPWWTGIHISTGIVLGLWGTPLRLVAILVVLWEVLEISVPGFGDEEINGNRAVDVAVALVGWLLAAWVGLGVADRPLLL